MGTTFLVRILVVLTALSVSCATESRGLPCEEEKVKLLQDLAGIQRGAGEALKEIAQTQRQKDEEVVALLRSLGKEENCQSQTLESKQSELILALNTLAGGLVRGFDVIEAKVDTQAKKVNNRLRAMQVGYEVGLERVEDRLEATQVSNKEASKRIEALELKMDTQVNETKDELRAIQASNEEGLGRVQDRLEAMKISNKEASKSIEALEQGVKALQTLEKNITHGLKSLTDRLDVIEAKEQLTRVASRRECWLPFERVGDDCVHCVEKRKTWKDGRRYCQALGGDLFVPANKERFVVGGEHPMSDPHPPLFDFLEMKRKIRGESEEYTAGWIGGSVDANGKATWTSGEKVGDSGYRGKNEDHRIEPLECFAARVNDNGTYFTASWDCSDERRTLCHML